MKLLLSIIFLTLSFSQDRDLWGCMDEEALNYDPYAIFCCSSCCIYEEESNQIVINEINYNPALSLGQEDSDYEFIELYNNSDEDVNLHGWYFNEGSSSSCYSFGDVTIEARGFLVLARNTHTYPGSISLPGHYLSNSGATITLRNSHYDLIDQVHYQDSCDDINHPDTCWPLNADAGGSSLELINPDLDNSLASSWQDSFTIPGGTPGYVNSTNDGSVLGCMDLNACNFDPEATYDDGSCEYPEENFDCNGECIADIDECGECGGDGIGDDECDCDGNILDCTGECGGDAVVDECGECGGDGIPEGYCDCNGNVSDCAGECGGDAVVDECGECGGLVEDEDLCPVSGFMLSFENYDVNSNCIDVVLSNESAVSGFQFDISGFQINSISPLNIDEYGFSVYNSESTIIGFSLSGNSLPSANMPILRIFFEDDYAPEFCINNSIVSDPNGESLDVFDSDCFSTAGCTDSSACEFNNYLYACDDCCVYPEQYWLDTDGDGLGYAQDENLFCEDPGTPWIQNHGDEFPNCFSNIVDDCGICDGDNSSCSGCTDENAFNYNCLNGNWPTTATFGCNEEVLISDDSCFYPPEGFTFNQSTVQSFYKFLDGKINNEPLEYMGSWIGAFKDGECVGSWPWVGEFTCVPVMGDDGMEYSDGYMLEGEFPEFYIYDPQLDDSFLATVSDNFEWIDLEIYHVDEISVDVDCQGVIGGTEVYDECGVCGGDGYLDNCLGTDSCDEMDCFGVCGGTDTCEEASFSNWTDHGFVLGDINIDFQTNVVDIANQINFILDYNTPNSYEAWASDLNIDMDLNVVDVVYLSGHILGLAKGVNNSEAYLKGNTLYTYGPIGGLQFEGKLISSIDSQDIINSNENKTIIYSLNNNLSTNEFQFAEVPKDLIIVSANGGMVDVKIDSPFLVSTYPNPFNPVTTINFSIPTDEYVSISVYNLNGEKVESLTSRYYESGSYDLVWNAESHSSGIYFVKIKAGNNVKTERLTLVK